MARRYQKYMSSTEESGTGSKGRRFAKYMTAAEEPEGPGMLEGMRGRFKEKQELLKSGGRYGIMGIPQTAEEVEKTRQPLVSLSEPLEEYLGEAAPGAGKIKRGLRGAAKGTAKLAEGLLTPENIGYMAALGPAGAAGKVLAAAGFGPHLAKGSLERGKEAYKSLKRGDIEAGVEAGVESAGQAALGFGLVKGGLKPKAKAARITKELKKVKEAPPAPLEAKPPAPEAIEGIPPRPMKDLLREDFQKVAALREKLPQQIADQRGSVSFKKVAEKPFSLESFQEKRGKITSLRRNVQDSWVDVKKLQKEPSVSKKAADPYEAKTLYAGRVAERVLDIKNKAEKLDADLVEFSTKSNLDPNILTKEINEYLQAKHAPERNTVHGEGAAGIKTADALRRIEEIEATPYSNAVMQVSDRILDLNKQALETLRDSQVIDAKTYKTLTDTYKNHVPLNRIMETSENVGDILTGRGFDVKGTGIRRAKGSQREVADILTNVVTNAEQAVIRAEKNLVDLETLKFARENKDLGIFEEIKPKAIGKTFAGKPILKRVTDPQVLSLREKGKPVHLKINDPHLAAAYRGINVEKVPSYLRGINAFTRLYSSLMTRFNPEFFTSNFLRDMQEMLVDVSSREGMGFKGAAKAASKAPKSMKDIVDYMKGNDTPGARLYKQMRMDGGTTGGLGLSTRAKVEVDLGKIRKLNRSKPRQAARKVIDAVDNLNQIFEDSTRLAVYKEALNRGLGRKKAAVLAKEATIDFNKKGIGTPIINALYMFSNASIQGNAKMLRAMSNPKVASAVVITVGTASFLTNQWNDTIDPEWRSKVSDYDRVSNLVFMLPTDKGIRYVTLPVSWGIKPIKAAFDSVYDVSTNKSGGIPEELSKVSGAIIESYNPVGGTDLASALVPSFADVPADLARNRPWYGGIIHPDYSKYKPEHLKYFKSLKKTKTGRASISLTKGLSRDFGIEISPADLKYAYESYIGGAGRFVRKTFDTVSSIGSGETPQARDVPFASRFYKTRTEEEVRKKRISEKKRARKKKKAERKYRKK